MKLFTSLAPVLFGYIFLFSSTGFAQEKTPEELDQQFSDLIEEANNYKNFKVIQESKLRELKAEFKSSFAPLQKEIKESQQKIQVQKKKIEDLQNKLDSTQNELSRTQASQDEIKFLGMNLAKSTFIAIFWIVSAILLVIIVVLIFVNRKNLTETKEAKIRLQQEERDFEDFRKKSLEKQQKLGRKLQDEINKNKKNNSDL